MSQFELRKIVRVGDKIRLESVSYVISAGTRAPKAPVLPAFAFSIEIDDVNLVLYYKQTIRQAESETIN